jgi:ERCC4-type nuclease
VKKRALLREFGTMKNLQECSVEALAGVGPLSGKDAQKVYEFFHNGSRSEDKETDKHQIPNFNIQTRNETEG